jgi:uncharacterized protein (TIGR02231 family)
MKKIALLIAMFLFIMLTAKADEDKTPVKSEITGVTVFLNGAQVTRTASAVLKSGQSYLVFEGLSQYVNSNSVQVKGTGNFTILSVSSEMDYMKDQAKPKEVTLLEDSLDSYNTQIEYQQGLLEVYKEEKNMIIANQSIGGTTTGVKIDELKASAEFFRTRLSEIKLKELTANAKIKKLQANVSQVNLQLTQLNAKHSIPTSEIIVAVSSNTITTATFEISYAVTGASWTPSYDLRATNTDSPIALDYKASVHQATGENWKNVKLKLCTGNPQQNGTKPSLSPWYLYVYNSYNDYHSSNAPMALAKSEKKDDSAGSDSETRNNSIIAQTSANYTTVNTNTTNFEFDINLPYTINSDGKTSIVEIQNYTLPASYQYYCAPKIDKNAYLIATVTGWEKFNLLSGYMNLYFDGTYVGKSYLNVNNTKDTLDVSLGRDENIAVERIKQEDYNNRPIIGLNRNVSFAWEIDVRNKKKTPVEILVEDQLPLSTDNQIVIEQDEISNAKYDETTGFLSWKLNLKSAEMQKIKFSYSVKFPKDKNVIIE